jgi:hypothetical protein
LRIDLAKAEALAAQSYRLSQFTDTIRETHGVFPLPFQQVKGQTGRRLLADAWQFGKFLNQARQRRGIGGHGLSSLRSEFRISDFIVQQ